MWFGFVEYVSPHVVACMVSNNDLNPSLATESNAIKVTLTSDFPTTVPSISCGGELAVVVGDSGSLEYSATFTITDTMAEGLVSCSVSNVTSLVGIPAQLVFSEDSSCQVTVGKSISRIYLT